MSTTTGTLTTRLRSLFSGFGTHRNATEDHTASRVMNAVMNDLVGHSVRSDAPETGDFATHSPDNTPTTPATDNIDVNLSAILPAKPQSDIPSYVDVMVQAGNMTGLNRVGDTYMGSYNRSKGQDRQSLLSAATMYTQSALLGSMDGLSSLYDCHRHGLVTPIPQYQALFDLVDYTRQTPGAAATKTYKKLINQIGLPEAEATDLRDDIWTRTSQKYAQAAQLEQRVVAKSSSRPFHTDFMSAPG